jgi:hypothetical protein
VSEDVCTPALKTLNLTMPGSPFEVYLKNGALFAKLTKVLIKQFSKITYWPTTSFMSGCPNY